MQSIRCSSCEYKQDVYFSYRVYNFGNLKFGLPIQANLGWCFACVNCVAVEVIPDLDDLAEELAYEQQKASDREAELDLPNNHLLWAEARLQWRRERVSVARCLECGSTDIRDFGVRGCARASAPVSDHPSCVNGGKLLLDSSGFVNYLGWTVYDPEGVCYPDSPVDG